MIIPFQSFQFCDSTYSGKDSDGTAGHQGLPGWSCRPPLPNTCTSDHSRLPRFPSFLVIHGSPDPASWAGITVPPLHRGSPQISRACTTLTAPCRRSQAHSGPGLSGRGQPFRACCVSQGPCSQPRKEALLIQQGLVAGDRRGERCPRGEKATEGLTPHD